MNIIGILSLILLFIRYNIYIECNNNIYTSNKIIVIKTYINRIRLYKQITYNSDIKININNKIIKVHFQRHNLKLI